MWSRVAKRGELLALALLRNGKRIFNCKFNSLVWLRCTRSKSDEKLVDTLWCDICKRFEENISGLKNFSDAWIEGLKNHKTSNVQDHASSEQHLAAMNCLKKTQAQSSGLSITSYSTID